MNQYIFKSKKGDRRILLGYDDMQLLVRFEIEGAIDPPVIGYLSTRLPWTENKLPDFEKATGGMASLVVSDLSFKAFWDAYNYKVGDKKRTERLWNLLPDADKALAIRMIKTYDSFLLAKKNMEKLYAETYLNQRRFENNFKL